MPVLRVVVVDDDESVRRLLAAALPLGDVEVEVVGEAADGAAGLEVTRRLRPDLVVLDHMMPGRTGASVITELRAVSPESEILLFSAYLDAPGVGEVLRRVTGEHGIESVPKGSFQDLEDAVTRIALRRAAARSS